VSQCLKKGPETLNKYFARIARVLQEQLVNYTSSAMKAEEDDNIKAKITTR
jgi:hypothetical protein